MTYHRDQFSQVGAILDNAAYLDAGQFEALCELNRSRGQSGLVNTRHYDIGGPRAYHRPGVVNYSAHGLHDHPNYQAMCGMAEVTACINGIYVKTRHNDYSLRAPVVGTYLQTAEVPLPAVPPSVLAQTTPEAQIAEMKEYFISFAAGGETRDHESYFRWTLSYLEVWPEVLSDTIGETYDPVRHSTNVATLYQAIAKHLLYSVTGHQDRTENTPYIPFVVRFADSTGEPAYALIRYRICAVDLGPISGQAPGEILAYRDQFALRQAKNLTPGQLMASRSARFKLFDQVGEQYQSAPGALDTMMAQIPGLNGGGTITETFNDQGGQYTTKQWNSSAALNAAYYNRFYNASFTASGRSNLRRGWNDPTLFVAANTRAECAPTLDPTMSNAERRYSYAIPLELILRTPLEAWNPYGIPLQTTVTGSGTVGSPYNGYNPVFYNHKVPAGFYAGVAPNGDPADTDAGDIRVLDSGGAVRVCRNSGIYAFLPPISGIASPIRIRYPIAPAYHEGSYEWAYCEALQEELAKVWDQLKAGGN